VVHIYDCCLIKVYVWGGKSALLSGVVNFIECRLPPRPQGSGHPPRTACESVATHSHPGRDIVFQLLDGRIELLLDGEEHEVAGGEIARFAGEAEISPTALEDSTALIVLAGRTE